MTSLTKLARILFISLLGLTSCSGVANRPEEISLPELKFEIPNPEIWSLENGLTVMFLRDEELPLIQGSLYFPGGSYFEPADSVGLASATGSLMREGGTAKFTPDELDQTLDDLGASIESSFGGEFGSLGFSCLSENFDEIFAIFAEILQKPRFEHSRLELWKQLGKQAILRRRDNPETMALMTFNALVYGQESPYAREPSISSIEKITRKSLYAFHQRFVRPDQAILAISGSIPGKHLKKKITSLLGNWKKGNKTLPPAPDAKAQPEAGIYLITRDFDQSTIAVGHSGPPRFTPDMYQMAVFNRIFGLSGFNSTLFSEVRTKRGLAYSVYGGLFPGLSKGSFRIDLGTKNENAWEAIRTVTDISRQATESLPEATKLKEAKESAKQSFVFKFSSPEAVVDRSAILELLDYPKDYDERYLKEVSATSAEDVKKLAARWINPENLIIVIVGRLGAKELQQQFGQKIKVKEVGFDTRPLL